MMPHNAGNCTCLAGCQCDHRFHNCNHEADVVILPDITITPTDPLIELRDLFLRLQNTYLNLSTRPINAQAEFEKGKAAAYQFAYEELSKIVPRNGCR